MNTIDYIYSRQNILTFLKQKKLYKSGILQDSDIDKKMKIKPNNPDFYSIKLELNDGFQVILQRNKDEEFPKYSAMLFLHKTMLCRLDYHDGHRRRCKKEIFIEEMYEDLHLHLYCEDCIKEKYKHDAFILNIGENKLKNFDFKCFVVLFCKIINLECRLDCQRSLFS